MTALAARGEVFQLAAEIEVIRRKESFLLFRPADARAVKASSAAVSLLPLLQRGAGFDELRSCLQTANPAATDPAPKLRRFLATLVETGVVTTDAAVHASAPRRERHKYPLLDLNPVAGGLAAALRPFGVAVLTVLVVATALAAAAAVIALALAGQLPSLRALMEGISLGGIFAFAVIVVPVHEFAHALACRLVGERVGAAGIILHGGLIPGPYVDTSRSYRIAGRWRRFAIPAAGPFVNLVAAGGAAVLLLCGNLAPRPAAIVATVLLLSLLFVGFDTNPFVASDGSHCLEALLGDELARRHALQPVLPAGGDAGVVRMYRIVMAAYVAAGLALLLLWWWR